MSTFKDMQDEHAARQAVLRERVGASAPPRSPPERKSPFSAPLSIDRPTPRPLPLPSAEISRDAALASVSGLTEQMVDAVNAGTVEVFENQKRVEEQARELRRKGAKFAGVTSEWVRIVRGFDDDLREIGDFEGWIKRVELDLNNLTQAMKKVAEQGSGSPRERGAS